MSNRSVPKNRPAFNFLDSKVMSTLFFHDGNDDSSDNPGEENTYEKESPETTLLF